MLLHCVFLDLADDADRGVLDDVLATFEGLVGQVPGMMAFAQGPNRDYEAKTPDHDHGFVCSFADRAAHLAYEAHPDHIRAGAALVGLCRGGAAGIRVYDLEVAPPA